MSATLGEFGDAILWQTPLQEVYPPDDESPDLDTNKCGESLDGSEILDEQMIEEECSDSNQPGEGANISSNITMVSVEFSLSLKEEMLVLLDEVHEMVRTVETHTYIHLLCWSGSASRRESWRWW